MLEYPWKAHLLLPSPERPLQRRTVAVEGQLGTQHRQLGKLGQRPMYTQRRISLAPGPSLRMSSRPRMSQHLLGLR